MRIRLSKLEDLHAMTDIYNQAILTGHSTADTETFTFEQRKPWFESHQNAEYPLYVIEKDGKVIGYVYLSAYRPGRKAMIKTVEVSYYVHQGYLRQGIGTKLLEFIIHTADELNYKTLVAILLERNIASIHLLKKFEFEEWGRIKDIAEFDDGSCSHLYLGLKI